MVAVVVLQKVDAYACKIFCVIELVTEASGISSAGLGTAAGIHSEFKSLGMNIIGYIFHAVRETLTVRNKHTVAVSFHFGPVVVYCEIFVSRVKQPFVYHSVGCFEYNTLVYISAESVP